MRQAFRFLPGLLWGDRPLHLTFHVTARCNFRCPFCFQPAAPPAAPPELSLEEYRRLAPSLGRLLWLLIGGGEPFLRPDLADICATLCRHARPAILTLTSNGSLPQVVEARTREILRRAPPHTLVVVKLSLDGLGAAHDALRGQPGSFDLVLESYARLRQLARHEPRLELGINSVLMAANAARMPGLIDFVASLPGRPAHTISLARGRHAPASCKAVSPASYLDAMARLEARGAGYRFAGAGLKLALDRRQHQVIAQTLAQGRRVIPCQSGRLSLVISARGQVFPCEPWHKSLGGLRDFGLDLAALLAAPGARAAREGILRGSCHCTHECHVLTSLLGDPRLYPAWLRAWLDRPAPLP